MTLRPAACQASLSMGFSRQEYWSKLPLPTPGDLPDTGIKPASLLSTVLSGGFFFYPSCPLGSPSTSVCIMENLKVMQLVGNNPNRYLLLALVKLWQVHVKIDKQIGCTFSFLF